MENVQGELNFGEGENWLRVTFSNQGSTPSPAERKMGEGLALKKAINI